MSDIVFLLGRRRGGGKVCFSFGFISQYPTLLLISNKLISPELFHHIFSQCLAGEIPNLVAVWKNEYKVSEN